MITKISFYLKGISVIDKFNKIKPQLGWLMNFNEEMYGNFIYFDKENLSLEDIQDGLKVLSVQVTGTINKLNVIQTPTKNNK